MNEPRFRWLAKSYVKSYYNFLFLWLILASIVPPYYFYKIGYYEEGKMWMRYLQLTAARQQELRDVELNAELLPVFGASVKEISKKGNFLNATDEQQIRQKGSWNTVHLLGIAIISIVVFLGLAQQELFKNFQAILAARAALLPLLARFGGIFTSTKEKE